MRRNEPKSRFTMLFERLAIDVMLNMDLKNVVPDADAKIVFDCAEGLHRVGRAPRLEVNH